MNDDERLWTTNPPSYAGLNTTVFTFPNNSGQGLVPNWSMVSYPVDSQYHNEWRVRVNGADPGVDSPSYNIGFVASNTIIEFTAKAVGSGDPSTEGKVYIKDENGTWNNWAHIHLINGEVGYNNGNYAPNDYNVYRVNLSEVAVPAAEMRQFSIQLTSGHGTGKTWTFNKINIYSNATNWDFANKQLGWSTRNSTTTGFPDGINWLINPNENDPGIFSLYLKDVNAANYPYLNIRMAVNKPIPNTCLKTSINPDGKCNIGGVYFENATGGFSETNSLRFTEDVTCNGLQKWYTMKMSDKLHWTGNISRLRIDPIAKSFADSSDPIFIDRIELSNTPRSSVTTYTGYAGQISLFLASSSDPEENVVPPPAIPGYTLNHTATCKAVDVNNLPINESSTFLNSDGLIYSWIQLDNVNGLHDFNWKWYSPNGLFADNYYSIPTDPAGQGYKAWYSTDISSTTNYGQWRIDTYVDGSMVNTRYFNLDPTLATTDLWPTNVATTSVTMNWNFIENAAGYRLYRNNEIIAYADLTQTSYSDTSLSPGTNYYYYLEAYFDTSVSTSGTYLVTTLPLPPATPTGLASSNLTTNSVTLNWQPVAGATTYSVYCNGVPKVTTTYTSFTDVGLTAATSYTYYVIARNGNYSPNSDSLTVTTPYATPDPPTNLAASNIASTNLNLNWTAGQNASGYRVYRNGVLIVTTTLPGFADIGLSASTSYSYYITSFNGNIESAPSSIIMATTSGPDRLTATNITTNTISLVWPQIADATSYQVFRNGQLVAETSQTSLMDSGLTSITAYRYSVIYLINGVPVDPVEVSLVSPLAGIAISGVACLTASASDNTGASTVEFCLPGVDLLSLTVVTL